MLACPGCGANLTYNIEKGKLHCEYCSKDYAPGDKRLKQKMAHEEKLIDAKVFTCPQCGGEMYTTDVDATAYCSYCGASNVLQSRVEGVDAPQKIIPFSVTKEECIGAFNNLARKTLYAPREFRNGSGEEKLRPLYVPYRIYDLELDGQARIYGKVSQIDGATRTTEERKIDMNIKANFENLAYDASAAFDDTLAEQIAPFNMKKRQQFDPVYLAGAYANIPDVDAEVYREKALEYVAGKSIEAMGKKSVFENVELEAYPDGSTLSDHMPVKKESSHTALLPVWFMSFRRGNRIAYAAVNGESGKVYSDIPISLPAFWLGSLLTAVPIFILLNLFVTMQPKTGLLTSCFLALVGAILYSGNYITILRREEHADDVGYVGYVKDAGETRAAGGADGSGEAASVRAYGADSSGGTRSVGGKSSGASVSGGKSSGGNRLKRWLTGKDDGIPGLKKGFTYYLLKVFSVWPYLVIMIIASIMFPPLFWTLFIVGSAIYCLRKTGGRITFWPWLLIALAAAGLAIREMRLVSDLWYYGCSAGILLVLVIALTRLLHQYNLLSTRPLPLLFKDGKTSGGGAGKTGGAVTGILALMISTVVLQLVMPITAQADVSYNNEETGFQAVIVDQENILTEEEEGRLEEQLKGLTQYGNAVFVSCSQEEQETLAEARDWYYQAYGNASGTIFMVDMGMRQLALYSAGANNEVIGREEGYVITDNVYTYASDGDYYECAARAFEQVGTLLEGGRIARPMKYINNALLALILAVLLNYAVICRQAASRRAGRDAISGNADYLPKVSGVRWGTTNAVTVFSFTGLCTIVMRFVIEAILEGESSGDGFSGGGGGGGGGGASGSGGSHGF